MFTNINLIFDLFYVTDSNDPYRKNQTTQTNILQPLKNKNTDTICVQLLLTGKPTKKLSFSSRLILRKFCLALSLLFQNQIEISKEHDICLLVFQ